MQNFTLPFSRLHKLLLPTCSANLNRSSGIRLHRQLLRWFADTPNLYQSPLSLHALVAASGRPPGQWHGPTSACQALMIAMARAGRFDARLAQIEVYFARDRTIFRQASIVQAKRYNNKL
ncbi:unnamed protein product [Protopolystoma xenopodis]|uniref:Cysteine protease n=1 Tax=Protopolystoma xenopodis TaxID=117903 RepID=A0A448X088_9PLAT|nr:unnamed protein product [Protopolystoma xenopodis]